MQICLVDLTVPQIFPWKILTPVSELSIIYYMPKISTLTEIKKFLGKTPFFFKKPKFGTFWEILLFQSPSTDTNFLNSEPDTSVKLDNINWRKRSISAFWMDDFPSIFKFAQKIIKVWMSPKTVTGNNWTLVLQCQKEKDIRKNRGLANIHQKR